MNVKDLKERIFELERQGVICDTTEVVAIGEYCYGIDVDNVISLNMAHLDDEEVVSEPKTVLGVTVDSYLYEHEDMGNCNMWVDENDYKYFLEVQDED